MLDKIDKKEFLTISILLFVSSSFALKSQHSSDEAFQAYSPGQYYQVPNKGVGASNPPPHTVGTRRLRLVSKSSSGELLYALDSPSNSPVKLSADSTLTHSHVPIYNTQATYTPNYYVNKPPSSGLKVQNIQNIQGLSERPRKVVYKTAVPVNNKQIVEQEEQEEYPSDPNPQYNFSFDVKDDELTNYQNRQEEREGGVIKGSYSVVDPDGYVRTVTYTADSKNGFQAKVTREPTDVKIKFPVPTTAAPEESPVYKIRAQKPQIPQYVPSYSPQYILNPNSNLQVAQTEPRYVLKRVVGNSGESPRYVKVLRQ